MLNSQYTKLPIDKISNPSSADKLSRVPCYTGGMWKIGVHNLDSIYSASFGGCRLEFLGSRSHA
jgi:hypothetical protein